MGAITSDIKSSGIIGPCAIVEFEFCNVHARLRVCRTECHGDITCVDVAIQCSLQCTGRDWWCGIFRATGSRHFEIIHEECIHIIGKDMDGDIDGLPCICGDINGVLRPGHGRIVIDLKNRKTRRVGIGRRHTDFEILQSVLIV